MRRAVFLDRDGTVIEDVGYLADPDAVRLVPGAGEAIAALNKAGYLVVVVSNQSGIARGLVREEDVEAQHARLGQLLREFGAEINSFYYCPHHINGVVAKFALECDCRKPRPGLLLRAAYEWKIDLRASFMVGDKWSDIAAGQSVGCKSILVCAMGVPGSARLDRSSNVIPRPYAVVRGLPEAVSVILNAGITYGQPWIDP
jgi:D-glycero-D-manno-heptose 1,7-bisphosphate phosphatase